MTNICQITIEISYQLIAVKGLKYLRDRLQISFLILGEFKRINKLLLPRNYQKIKGFLMVSGGIEVI